MAKPNQSYERENAVRPDGEVREGYRLTDVQDIKAYEKNPGRARIGVHDVDRFRWELHQMPNGKREMLIDGDYYDGNQFTDEQLMEYEDRGIPAIVTNLIGPTVDLCIGMMAKTESDWVVKPQDNPKLDDMAMAISQRINVAEKQSKADDACFEAGKDLFKVGLGWVEVARESNPWLYPIRCQRCEWTEFGLDPHSQNEDINVDAQWLKRSKFFDRTRLEALFHDKAKELSEIGPGWRDGGQEFDDAPMLRSSAVAWRDYSMYDIEWMDADRDRLMLDEIWYKVWVRGEILRLRDGTTARFDENNPAHDAAIERGLAELHTAAWYEMRCAFFVGPLLLQDIPSPYSHRKFPYVPFWGLRDARTKSPYGIIRRQRPMQDEVNARSSKMMWALSSRRTLVSAEAFEDHDAMREEVARPDAYMILDKRFNKKIHTLEIDDNRAIGDEQYKLLVDRVQRIQDVAGAYQTMLGKKDGGADSGIAINALIEQGATTLAPLFSNYRKGRRGTGELMLSLVMEDLAKQQNVQVQVEQPNRRIVHLNRVKQEAQPEIGLPAVIENNVRKARLQVVLDDLPASASFRAQQFMRIAEVVALLSKVMPEAGAKMLDLLVEASDVPNKQQFLERIRELIGINPDPATMTEEQRAQFEQKAQKAAQMQHMQERAMVAEVAGKEAKASKDAAAADKTGADTQAVLAGIEKILAQVQEVGAKTNLALAQSRKALEEAAAIKSDRLAQDAVLAAGGPGKVEALIRW